MNATSVKQRLIGIGRGGCSRRRRVMSGSCAATVVMLEGLTRRGYKSSWSRMEMLLVSLVLETYRKSLGQMPVGSTYHH